MSNLLFFTYQSQDTILVFSIIHKAFINLKCVTLLFITLAINLEIHTYANRLYQLSKFWLFLAFDE